MNFINFSKDFKLTILFSLFLSSFASIVAFVVQLQSEKHISSTASYLDPILIDILAFLAALFLIFESCYRIWEHRKNTFSNQCTRSIRMAFGFSILTIHIMQFIHK